MSNGLTKQRGYALPEVLIATAIAAGVLTTAATAAGGIVHLDHASAERATRLAEAKLITSRLHGGMDERDALDGLEGWRLTYEPYESEVYEHAAPPFNVVTASFGDDGAFRFQTLISSQDGLQ